MNLWIRVGSKSHDTAEPLVLELGLDCQTDLRLHPVLN